jgi:hypothetical protein
MREQAASVIIDRRPDPVKTYRTTVMALDAAPDK